jgi:hypothetical protein
MATTSFKKINDQITDSVTQVKEVPAEIVPAAPKAIVVHAPTGNGIEGEISRNDIKLPRINLVQKVGDLSNLFSPGIFLFNKEVILSNGKTPFEVTVLRLRKQYQQDIPYGSEEMPQSYDTADEVLASGGSLKWGDDNYYKEIAHVQLAMEKPSDCPSELEGLFPHVFEDKQYGVAIWTLTGSAFTSAGKTLITAAYTLLKAGLHTGKFAVTSEIKKNAKNSWYAPVLKFAGKHSPEAVAFFESIK